MHKVMVASLSLFTRQQYTAVSNQPVMQDFDVPDVQKLQYAQPAVSFH